LMLKCTPYWGESIRLLNILLQNVPDHTFSDIWKELCFNGGWHSFFLSDSMCFCGFVHRRKQWLRSGGNIF
jgi:hypothetical protein